MEPLWDVCLSCAGYHAGWATGFCLRVSSVPFGLTGLATGLPQTLEVMQ